MDTPENAATIKALAEHANLTHGAIMRAVLEGGGKKVKRDIEREHGALPDELYAAHLRQETERGQARAAAGASVKRAERALARKHRPRSTA